MIIQSASLAPTVRADHGTGAELQKTPGQSPFRDSVQFSQNARDAQASRMAIASPALLLSDEQVQIKMSLVRTLMEAIFGQRESQDTTPEKEMVQAVMEEPQVQQALLTMSEESATPTTDILA